MDKHPISKTGFEKLQLSLKELKEVERPKILEVINWARSLGDLSENADYKTAKEDQRNIDREIHHIESIVSNANIIDVDQLSGDKVMFGATVIIEDEDSNKKKYKILAECEADLSQNIISITSPMARGFVGKCVGDYCVIKTPSGEKEYEIVEVKYGKN